MKSGLQKEPGQEQPLLTWGEIANHLNVSIRTAQYWERERGLPIYRNSEAARSRVSAYPSQLDQWNTQTLKVVPQKRRFRGWVLSLFLLPLVAVGLLWHASAPQIASAEFEAGRLATFDEDGSLLWERFFPGAMERAYRVTQDDLAGQEQPLLVISDTDGDDENELIFLYSPKDLLSAKGGFICFETDGTESWRFFPGEPLYAVEAPDAPPRIFNDAYSCRFLAIHENYFIGEATHNPFYPSRVFVLNLESGELISDFWHPGYLNMGLLADLDGDGRKDLLLGGTNNPGQGVGHAVLLAFHIPFDRRPKGMGDFLDTDFGPFKYLVFKRPDICESQAGIMGVGSIFPVGPEKFACQVAGRFGQLVYTFDFNLNLLKLDPSDEILQTHFDYFLKGLIDHDLTDEEVSSWTQVLNLDTIPNGNSPELVELFGSPSNSDPTLSVSTHNDGPSAGLSTESLDR